MPVHPKTKVKLLLIAAILNALAGGFSLLAAFEDHQRRHIAQCVMWFSLCIIFLSNARKKRKAIQSGHGDSSKDPKERSAQAPLSPEM